MEKTLKRQQRTVGAIVKVPLEDDYHTYARILESQLAFYDCKTKTELTIDNILKTKVLFIVAVFDDVITRGIWTKISKAILPIEPHLLKLQDAPLYTEDINTGEYTIYYNTTIRKATKEEIIGLESFTVWDWETIEQRLNDYYANRFNQDSYDSLNGRQTTGIKEWIQQNKIEIEFGGLK